MRTIRSKRASSWRLSRKVTVTSIKSRCVESRRTVLKTIGQHTSTVTPPSTYQRASQPAPSPPPPSDKPSLASSSPGERQWKSLNSPTTPVHSADQLAPTKDSPPIATASNESTHISPPSHRDLPERASLPQSPLDALRMPSSHLEQHSDTTTSTKGKNPILRQGRASMPLSPLSSTKDSIVAKNNDPDSPQPSTISGDLTQNSDAVTPETEDIITASVSNSVAKVDEKSSEDNTAAIKPTSFENEGSTSFQQNGNGAEISNGEQEPAELSAPNQQNN